VLESKVLRSRGFHREWEKARGYSNKQNEDWLADGVDQVYSYRSEMNAVGAFLCCYDKRDHDDDTILSCVKEAAEEKGVVVRRYYVTRSHHAMRRGTPDSAWSRLAESRGIEAN
jgi:hypothetical protein